MKKYIVLLLCAFMVHANNQKQLVEIDLGLAQKGSTQTLPLVCGVVGDDPAVLSYATELQKALEWSGQVKVSLVHWQEQPKKKKTLLDLNQQGYALGLIISSIPNGFEWRLYDLTDATMLGGKKVYAPQTFKREDVYIAAGDIWRELMSQESPFANKIAFLSHNKKHTTTVSICSYDGSLIGEFTQPTQLVGLIFNESSEHPRLLTSELTNKNVKVVSLNFTGQKWDVFNFSGTCLGVSVSGAQALYCRSGDIWHFTYNPLLKKGIHTQIISNGATNMAPTQLPDGSILFATDLQEAAGKRYPRGPKIALYHLKDKLVEFITQDGSSLSPSYCPYTQQIAYSRKVGGHFQIFVYDRATKTHKQMTSGAGNKTDPVWSSCGLYLMYGHQQGALNVIIQQHIKTGITHRVSPEGRSCVSPCWIISR